MTSRQLREALRDIPDDAAVVLQGCDCINAAHSLALINANQWGPRRPRRNIVLIHCDLLEDVVS
jgi:hypothetical protein